jgi:hypothetical protein
MSGTSKNPTKNPTNGILKPDKASDERVAPGESDLRSRRPLGGHLESDRVVYMPELNFKKRKEQHRFRIADHLHARMVSIKLLL